MVLGVVLRPGENLNLTSFLNTSTHRKRFPTWRLLTDLGPETNRSPNPTPFTREALVGVVMTVENAESLGKWILEKVSQAKQRTCKK
jgi:hypothetical protein